MAASQRRPVVFLLPLAALVAVVLGVLGYALLHGVNAGRTNTLIGKAAPNFSYTTFDGKTVDLASLKGKPVLVNFWGSWCVPCKDEEPVLSQAWSKYQGSGVQFVGIAIWDKTDAAQSFARQYGATWTNGVDNDGKIAIDYGVYGVPESFFIGRDGTLVDRFVGPFVGSDGATHLDQYLQRLASQ
ncbi:MAG: redoxin domain-containing protein [Chloroflexi bacterium]|nr:redoxin domain-containing protein [Chloroflexota bacterium]